MKPRKTKTFQFRNKALIALFVSVVFFAGCQKDASFDNSAVDNSTPSAESGKGLLPGDSTSTDRAGNQAPVIKTGPDQTHNPAVTSITLDGSGSYDPDGYIASYSWTKDFGPGGNIQTPASKKTTVTSMVPGEYRFKLKITDNRGTVKTDTIHISNGSGGGSTTPPPTGGNVAPVVNAGNNQTITLPTAIVTLSGSATDADGIASYQWTKVSGTGGVITSPNSATTTVTALVAGTYTFNLKATDTKGLAGNKTVTVTVNPASTTPPPAAGYTLTFSTGYDAMSDMLFNGNGQYGNGTISTSMFVNGPGSFYSRPANVSSGTRSEVQYNGTAQNPTEGAVEYDVRYETIIPDNGHSFQWHPNTGGGSASPGLWHIGGKFVMVNWKSGGNAQYPTGMTIQANKWYHMRMEFKFGSAGYFRLYIDGALKASWTGQVGDGSGQYMKVGYNGWDGNSANSRIYYDNLKVYKKG